MLKKIAFLLLLIAPMSVFAQKFAHFKSMDIIPVMPEYAKAQTDIQTMQKQYEDEIKRASDEFNKKYAEYQQEQKNLPQNIQERRQKELQELSEKGMQFQQDAQQQFQSLVLAPCLAVLDRQLLLEQAIVGILAQLALQRLQIHASR